MHCMAYTMACWGLLGACNEISGIRVDNYGDEVAEAHLVEVSAGTEHWLALTKEGKVIHEQVVMDWY